MAEDWRKWLYTRWNRRLIEYCFRDSLDSANGYVERIPATPEELVEIVGDPDANPYEVATSLVASIKHNKGSRGFESFCRSQRYSWKTSSQEPPIFFAALWLTCLVAYGYPLGSSNRFHERIKEVLGAAQHLSCLPELWRDMADWTTIRSEREHDFSALRLPPRDDYRKNIGNSWFLAYPHHGDRRRLRLLLEAEDLVGDEPPIEPVVRLLKRNLSSFGTAFREDLQKFSEGFLLTDAAIRDSPFWRAIRQEALAPRQEALAPTIERDGSENIPRRRADPNTALMAEIDDGDLHVYVACTGDARLPPGYSSCDFGYELDGYSHYVAVHEDESSLDDGCDLAATAALNGTLPVPKAVMYARRGVLVFQEMITNEYRLAGGAEANQAGVALVREDRLEAFERAYGGTSRPSKPPGWHQVIGCRVQIRAAVPTGLEGVRHLQETMIPPSIRLVDGIRTGDGFYAFPGFLPRIRFDGASRVDVTDEKSSTIGEAKKSRRYRDEWIIPQNLVREVPCGLRIRAHWKSDRGRERLSETRLILLDRTTAHNYKHLASGSYLIESCAPGERLVPGKEEMPFDLVSATDISAEAISPPVHPGDSKDPGAVVGLEPDYRASHVADALAALSVRRSGIPRRLLFDLFSAALGVDVRENPVLFYDLVRGWMESGAIDVALAQGRKESVIAARHPGFVVFRSGDSLYASLSGVVPSKLADDVREACDRLGLANEDVLPPCEWLPKTIRIRSQSFSTIEDISRKCGIRRPKWLELPTTSLSHGMVQIHPGRQSLRDAPVPPSFEITKQWDWAHGRFVKNSFPKAGIRVQRREHAERASIYVVVVDGEEFAWTYIRNWALLYAEHLNADWFGEEAPVFTTTPNESIVRNDEAYIYLPLPVGRLCAIAGIGLSGPILNADRSTVEGYVYPLGGDVLRPLSGWISSVGCIGRCDV